MRPTMTDECGNKKVHGSSALSAALRAPPSNGTQPSCQGGVPAGQHSLQSASSKPRTQAAASLSSSGKLLPHILPFWSCFTSRTGELSDDCRCSAVVSAEVGIRPSFYWLDADADVSEEERFYAEASARWIKNDCQDDVVVVPNFANLPSQVFAGVFDGHGPYGRLAAKCASTHLPGLLAGAPAMASRGGDRKRLRAMRDACAAVDACMRDPELCGFDASLSGTTACFVVVCGRKVYLANTGDSRCVLARRSSSGGAEAIQMTWDAKPDHPQELKRIRDAGGVVGQLRDERGEHVGAQRVFCHGDDVLPGLAMSRSLGDLYAHTVGVTNEPVMTTYTLGEQDLFLVLGTDGLWDIMSNAEVVDFIERYRNGRAQDLSCAEALTLEAQERWKARHAEALVDDISVAIIHMAPLGPVNRSAHVRSPLAHAASCNDEANALFRSWQLDWGRNPSNHRPRRYFQHLYNAEDAPPPPLRRQRSEGAALGATAAAAAPLLRGRSLSLDGVAHGSQARLAAAAAAEKAAEEDRRRHFPRGPVAAAAGEGLVRLPQPAGLAASPSPQEAPSSSSPSFQGPGPMLGQGLPSADEVNLCRSSWDLDCEHDQSRFGSVGSLAVGSKFNGAFGRSPSVRSVNLGTVPSSPIPCAPKLCAEMDSLLRPIRKAYPSQSGGLCSFKSEASILNNPEDTPRSGATEGGDSRGSAQSRNFGYEGKLRGGLPRTISAPILAHAAARLASSYETPTLSCLQAASLDDRTLGQLASCTLTDSPTDSTLSSPYPTTISPVGPPLGAPAPLCTPYAVAPKTSPAALHGAGAGAGFLPGGAEFGASTVAVHDAGTSARGGIGRAVSEVLAILRPASYATDPSLPSCPTRVGP